MLDQLLDEFERTEELMLKELRKINAKGDLTPQEVCSIKEIAESTYYMQIVEAMEDGGDSDYSDYYPDGDMMSSRRGRDMRTGRYVSRRGMRSYEGDRMTSGHSLHDRMIAALENTMDQAKSDYDRQQIKEWIHKIQMDENKQ
jgi:hypothetical protein